MQQRQLRLGDILDDYCPRERRVTNHAVVAMLGSDVKQTRCTTCDAEHEYKHAKVPRQRRKSETPAALYSQVLANAPKRVAHGELPVGANGSNGIHPAEDAAADMTEDVIVEPSGGVADRPLLGAGRLRDLEVRVKAAGLAAAPPRPSGCRAGSSGRIPPPAIEYSAPSTSSVAPALRAAATTTAALSSPRLL